MRESPGSCNAKLFRIPWYNPLVDMPPRVTHALRRQLHTVVGGGDTLPTTSAGLIPQSEDDDERSSLDRQALDVLRYDVLRCIRESVTQETFESWIQKLQLYQPVEKISDITTGRYIRWINLVQPDLRLAGGGVVATVKFTDEGTLVLCRLPRGQYIQCRFDKSIVFERLTDNEQLLLAALEQLS